MIASLGEIVFFAAAIGGFAWLLVTLLSPLDRSITLTCNCGQTRMRDLAPFTPIDVAAFQADLARQCPRCSAFVSRNSQLAITPEAP